MMRFLTVALASLALLSPAVAQQTQTFLMNTGNTPNCTSLTGKNGFEINFFSLGGTDNVSSATSPNGQSSRKIQLGPLSIHKNFDACSEALLKSFLSGTIVKTVTLTEYRTTESESFASMEIDLSNALISNYQITNADTPVSSEVLAFTYSKACVSSTAQNSDGSAGTKTTVCYDLSTGKVM